MSNKLTGQYRGLKPFKPGESGNPAGRPKGSSHKISESFMRDFHESWQKHGKEAIEAMCADSPKDYVRVGLELTKASIPKQLKVEDNGSAFSRLTDEQLESILSLALLFEGGDTGVIEGETVQEDSE